MQTWNLIEIQSYNDGRSAIPAGLGYVVSNAEDEAKAISAFHSKCALAAVSTVNVHSAVMLDDTGMRIKGETYYHGTVAE